MSTLIVNTLKNSAGIHTMTVNDLNLGSVKAWVRWDSSSGSPVIIDDYNIAAGSDEAVGEVNWTFEKPFRSAYSYAFAGMTSNGPEGNTTASHEVHQRDVQTATQFGTRAVQISLTTEDNVYNAGVWVGISTGSYITYKP
tara:strand:- start:1282 stop:1701 length:420 start_codon:yes stop_codon:yes gene_type:complete